MSARLRGADVLARSLRQAGTRILFSLSGNQIMPLYDAAIDARIDIVHVRHEGAAVHMADAWGRLTGEPGIALVTGGPGHANAIGALYTALAAEAPLVLLSGHAPLAQLGMDAFQEMRQADIAAPVVKASWTAQSPLALGADIARAIRIARAGRPGPVHVSLPFDVLEARIGDEDAVCSDPADDTAHATPLSEAAALAILEQVKRAKRPVIITGPALAGARGADVRTALAQARGVPVLSMESPRGVNDPGLGAVADVLAETDLVVLIGKKLDFTLRFGRPPAFSSACRFVQVDPDPQVLARAAHASADRSRIVLVAIADAVSACERLADTALTGVSGDEAWFNAVDAACRYRPPEWETATSEGAVHPAAVGRAVQGVIDRSDESVLVIDGGEFGQWSQACVHAPVRLINGPAGSIGSGLPFALAAKCARPNANVIAMLGDGTFGFHMAEVDTALRHDLPFVAVIGNDACWNAEHQIQLASYGRERAIGCELLPSRYDLVAAALGGHGELVSRAAELPAALERAIASGKPACVNVMVERLAAPVVSRKAPAARAGH